MNEYIQQAIEKIDQEAKTAKGDWHVKAVKDCVVDKLKMFCQQDAEFAQAVVQGGPFEECLTASVKGAQNHTEDITVYRQAVQYYFPGADIKVTMTINLCGDVDTENLPAAEMEKKGAIVLNIEDYL